MSASFVAPSTRSSGQRLAGRSKVEIVVAAIFCVLLWLAPRSGAAQNIAVRFGQLVTTHGVVIRDAVVLVTGDRITGVLRGDIGIPRDAKVIDLRPLTGVPGMIDVHVHLTFYRDLVSSRPPWKDMAALGPIETVFLAQANAQKTLNAGVTTVRDLGAYEGTSFAMRDLIDRGAMPGPRMFVAGCGLHITDEASGTSDDPFNPPSGTPDPCRADGVDQVERAARQQLAAGADWLKIFASTGGDERDVTGFETFGFDEIKAAIDTAHRAGKRVAVHSYGPEGARDAVKAGADSIEHAIDIDDATLSDMARKGVVYVPTIDHIRYYMDHQQEFALDAASLSHLKTFHERGLETLRRAIKAHVLIAMGSDAVLTAFGENTRELTWFVTAGLTNAQALDSATVVGADLLGKRGELGVVAAGAFADLVAIDGDPLSDIAAVQNVKWVMKGGAVMLDKR